MKIWAFEIENLNQNLVTAKPNVFYIDRRASCSSTQQFRVFNTANSIEFTRSSLEQV